MFLLSSVGLPEHQDDRVEPQGQHEPDNHTVLDTDPDRPLGLFLPWWQPLVIHMVSIELQGLLALTSSHLRAWRPLKENKKKPPYTFERFVVTSLIGLLGGQAILLLRG